MATEILPHITGERPKRSWIDVGEPGVFVDIPRTAFLRWKVHKGLQEHLDLLLAVLKTQDIRHLCLYPLSRWNDEVDSSAYVVGPKIDTILALCPQLETLCIVRPIGNQTSRSEIEQNPFRRDDELEESGVMTLPLPHLTRLIVRGQNMCMPCLPPNLVYLKMTYARLIPMDYKPPLMLGPSLKTLKIYRAPKARYRCAPDIALDTLVARGMVTSLFPLPVVTRSLLLEVNFDGGDGEHPWSLYTGIMSQFRDYCAHTLRTTPEVAIRDFLCRPRQLCLRKKYGEPDQRPLPIGTVHIPLSTLGNLTNLVLHVDDPPTNVEFGNLGHMVALRILIIRCFDRNPSMDRKMSLTPEFCIDCPQLWHLTIGDRVVVDLNSLRHLPDSLTSLTIGLHDSQPITELLSVLPPNLCHLVIWFNRERSVEGWIFPPNLRVDLCGYRK
jgi:hypothetical protein